MRPGVRFGIDVGKARIGVALCDPSGLLAMPLETVARAAEGQTDLQRILELAREYDAFEIVVGLPLGLGGHRTPSTEDAQQFAVQLADLGAGHSIGVRLVDERLSTVSAQGQLRQAGRNTKQSRAIIDQAAAVVILQHALDMERARGEAVGEMVTPTPVILADQAHVSTENEHT